jgi:hypothetical protein
MTRPHRTGFFLPEMCHEPASNSWIDGRVSIANSIGPDDISGAD